MTNEYTEEFGRFWAAFPSLRKVAKRKAWDAWRRAIKRAEPEVIISAAKEYAESNLGRSKFACGPAPWLNGDRWEDDREAWNLKASESNGKRGVEGMLPVAEAGEGF
jgi:hypothetical protein